MRLRLERIDASYKTQGKDTLIELITNVYDDYKKRVDYKKKLGNKEDADIFDTFVRQVGGFWFVRTWTPFKNSQCLIMYIN